MKAILRLFDRPLSRFSWYSIFKRETYAIFVSPMAYVMLTAWLLFCGFTFWVLAQYHANQMGSAQDSPLTAFFGQTTLFYMPLLVFAPLITMRLLAEERNRGTIETLMTAPVSEAQVVIGKYLAALLFWVAMWVPTGLYVWLTSRYGDVDLGAIGTSYLGIFGIGVYYLAIGVLMSAVSRNQIVSAVLTFLALSSLFVLGLGQFVFGDEQRELFAYVSIWGHMEAFSRGIVDTRFVTFDLSIAALAITLAVGALRSRAVGAALLARMAFGGTVGRMVQEGEDAKVRAMGGAERRGEMTTYTLLGVLLLVTLVFQVNYLSYRHYERWDLTAHSIYTLSDRSKAVIAELDRNVEIWILLSEAEPGFGELRNPPRALRGGVVAHHDPLRRIPTATPAATARSRGASSSARSPARTGASSRTSPRSSSPASGTGRSRGDDLISASFDPMSDENTVEINVEGERAITGALVELQTGRPTRVCVTQGHGEMPLSGGARSLAGFVREVQRENLELTEIETRGGEAIDDACDAVAIIGPAVAFSPPEVDRLRAYVRGGGNLFVALEPIIPQGRAVFAEHGLEDMLRDFGVRAERALVVEPNTALAPARGAHPIARFYAVEWGEHAITEPFRQHGLPVVVGDARPITPIDEERAHVLLSTSEASYGETDVRGIVDGRIELGADAGDVPGPVALAVATTVELTPGAADDADDEDDEDAEPSGGRVVVLGDADIVSSEPISDPTNVNGNFASAAVGWLTQREALISIEARSYRHRPVSMREEDISNLFLRVVVLIPLAFMFLGFAVWWNRRS